MATQLPGECWSARKFLARHAKRAGRLEDTFRDDFAALTTESLIKAVESRLDHDPGSIERALVPGIHPGAVLFRAPPAV
jgi:hypothetical protein